VKEKIKSIILIILVINSLILTWLLIYYSPYNDHTTPLEYQTRLKFGKDLELRHVLKPKHLIIHSGDNQHYLVANNNILFKSLEEEMKNWSFHNFYPVYRVLDWEDIMENKEGIEIVFGPGLSNSLLMQIFIIPSDIIPLESINRVWITTDNNDNMIAYFLSDQMDKVYAAKPSVTNGMLNHYLNNINDLKDYSYYWQQEKEKVMVKTAFYLPNEEIKMNIVKKFYTPLSDDDFIQLLFIDPALVRKVYDKDYRDHILYTDGSRSLQVYPHQYYINYFYHSINDIPNPNDLQKDLQGAVRFVNQHGGWEGSYQLDSLEHLEQSNQSVLYFHQYLEGYPIIDEKEKYGEIVLNMSGGIAHAYQRAMILLDQNLATEEVLIFSGTELLRLLEEKGIFANDINLVELRYQVKRTKDYLELIPVWHVNYQDSQIFEIPAFQSGV